VPNVLVAYRVSMNFSSAPWLQEAY